MVATTTARQRHTQAAVSAEYARWKNLGVATFPGPLGKKGPREPDWPNLPHAAAWALTELAATSALVNLVVRTGPTADGTRWLAAIDLDGKCPCAHDQDAHHDLEGACSHVGNTDRACPCQKYDGVPPDTALALLLPLLPPGVAVSRTARGYHIIFWVERPLPNGTLPMYSADVFGGRDPHALQVPPSLHPSGAVYQWVQEPGADLPVVDLEAVGLAPDPTATASARPRLSGTGGQRTPATADQQAEFETLMAALGVRPRGRIEEFHNCPFHGESEPSLHVDWRAAVFHCFGSNCAEQGGLRRLRELVGDLLPPSCNPSSDPEGGVGRGLQLGGKQVRAERDRLADGLDALGEVVRAERMRGCREATFDAADADLEAYACPNGDAAPVKTRTNSCDDAQCPTCMPWRLGSDWNRHWAKIGLEAPAHLTLVRLTATERSVGLDDWQYTKRARDRFREWQRARGLLGGFYGLTLVREDDSWRAELLVAVGDEDAQKLTGGRAFSVEVLGGDLNGQDILRAWQHAYLNEATAWRDLGELAAFRALIKGRRKFQGFGQAFATKVRDQEEAAMDQEAQQPLHRVAGGSGSNAKKPPCCPRCGERLRRIGPFDPSRMEMSVAEDGVPEWRWRTGPEQ